MDIESSLKSIGLNYREIQVYLATLELGESTVTPISKKSGFKRTYCYDILEELKKKKLVDYIEKNGRRQYFAQDPQMIEQVMAANLASFQAFLPDLRSIYNRPSEKPKVRYFEGKEGIIEIYEMNTKAKELLALGSAKHIYEYLPDYFDAHAKINLKTMQSMRELLPADSIDAPYLKYDHDNPGHQVRFLPEGITFSTDIMIFENKLAMISYGSNLHGIVVESSTIVDTMKILFELLWNQAKPTNN